MSIRSFAARTCLFAVLAGLFVSLAARASLTVSEDRNRDGLADVWRYYSPRGELSTVLKDRNFDGFVDAREGFSHDRLVHQSLDRNFDHRFDFAVTVSVVDKPDLTFNLELQPFLLPGAAVADERPADVRIAPVRHHLARLADPGSATDRAPPLASL